ncbi:MAG: alpha/beta hydrolase, partial [Mycobacterium sp.]
MTRPTVSQAQAWRPEALTELADGWDSAAGQLQAEVDTLTREAATDRDGWTGAAAGAGWGRLAGISSTATALVHSLVTAATVARDGAG